MTILTTASNLEDLIDSKPTARGQVLSRFMGLDFLKLKEETAKELYSDFSKSMLSNVYNTEQLKVENDNSELKIQEYKINISELNKKLVDLQERIIKGQNYRDGLLKSKYTDIDKEISLLQPDSVNQEITKLKSESLSVQTQIDLVVINKPSKFYDEEKHDEVKEKYQIILKEKIEIEVEINNIEKLQKSVSGGIKCEHCGIELINAAITQSKISELAGLKRRYEEKLTLMHEIGRAHV